MKAKLPSSAKRKRESRTGLYITVLLAGVLFFVYTHDLTGNPPGFYVDEATFAYNAYCLAKTGASEFGVRWPLFFQHFDRPFTVFGNPVHTYLLSGLFVIFQPSIWLARLLSALTGFGAGILLGFLALKISGKKTIAAIVGLTALATPWFFEFARWFSDASYYPLVLTLFLLALYRASLKLRWAWSDVICIAISLGLVTYTYTIGRLLGPLLALGLICFAISRQRVIDLIKTWAAYGLVLIPWFVFYLRQPQAVTSRFAVVSYLHTEKTLQGLLVRFITRYFQDLSLVRLLISGDINPRHHVPGATGSILAATWVLAVVGFVIVLLNRRDDPWWRFIIFGTFASVIPGALTIDSFHTGRMIAYPVFLMVLTIPALERLIERAGKTRFSVPVKSRFIRMGAMWRGSGLSFARIALFVVIAGTLAQAAYFQAVFWREGRSRTFAWDATYKEAYDTATQLPSRPIYLLDGYWGPAYVNALWYATVEGRSTSEFVHLPYRAQPPPGALVISSDKGCVSCQMIFDNNHYIVYRKF